MTHLPEWLLNELPAPKLPAILKYENHKYIAVSPDGEELSFDIVDEAYDHVQKVWKLEVEFDESLPGYTKDTMRVWGKRTKHGTRMLFSHTDQTAINDLTEDYDNFLKLFEKYKNNPEDFKTVYDFVDQHPAFWSRYSKDHPMDWMTYGHCSLHNGRLTLIPLFNDDESYQWLIETGPHNESDYNTRYHDYKLDSKGKTVEETYINLAKNIVKFYNFDGSAKENVPHVKPEWILEVEKTLRKLDEDKETT